MARSGTIPLDRGDLFPAMELQLSNGGKLKLPGYDGKLWTIFLVYRGNW